MCLIGRCCSCFRFWFVPVSCSATLFFFVSIVSTSPLRTLDYNFNYIYSTNNTNYETARASTTTTITTTLLQSLGRQYIYVKKYILRNAATQSSYDYYNLRYYDYDYDFYEDDYLLLIPLATHHDLPLTLLATYLRLLLATYHLPLTTNYYLLTTIKYYY